MFFAAQRLVILGAVSLFLAGISSAAAAVPCANLKGLMPLGGNSEKLVAEENTSGTVTISLDESYKDLPPFCKVTTILKPSPDSMVSIEVWLPIRTWNGKFLGTGNSGYADLGINHFYLAEGLRRGYAVANTDMGAVPYSADGSFLAPFPERQKDWGFRATNAMTVAAKRIVKAYYGSEARHSYFFGCSTGGEQALMEAQRFPEDYDGIIGGAPGNNRTHLLASFVWGYQAVKSGVPGPGPQLPQAALAFLNKSVLNACAGQADGNSADPFLNDPRECKFDAKVLQCMGSNTDDCLTKEQIRAVSLLYDGPRNPKNGHLIYPGWPRGSEIADNALTWQGLHEGMPIPGAPYDGMFRWVINQWMWQDFKFTDDMALVDKKLAPILNAMNTDLRAFAKRGGKLILYHGWADAIVAPQDTINYYESVVAQQGGLTQKALEKTQSFARLFLAPGMAHCSGGPGPNFPFAGTNDPETDGLVALDHWVTTGTAPKKFIAKSGATSRPLCPHPQRAKYIGTDGPSGAAKFTCVDGSLGNNNQVAAPEYRK
jgi:feruloyl esterase